MNKFTILTITSLASVAFGFEIKSKIDPSINTRIVGGNDAVDGQFPYQVSIKRSIDGVHSCGGSIISEEWILTAAHCVFGTSVYDSLIYAGSANLFANGVTRHLSQIVVHTNYTQFSAHDDLALLRLEEPLQFSEYIQPISLQTEEVGEVDCVVSGWGLLATDSMTTEVLQYINIKTLQTQECEQLWGSAFAEDREICVCTQSGLGFCSGDSGDPLVVGNVQIGVAAWGGFPCADGEPDVYAKVSSYIGWIYSVTGLH